MKSRLYEYNSSFYYLLRPYLIHGLDGKTSDKGWKANSGKINAEQSNQLETDNGKNALDKEALVLIETFVKKFRERGSQLIFVVSPNYGRSTDSSSTLQYLRAKSQKENIPLFVYSSDTTFITKPNYFGDPNHLNEEGAQIFTRDLVQKIKPKILQADQITF